AATVPPEASALEIGRTDLLGGWAISSGGETCQLFMSLTTWTGGYRASTRGCNGPQLSGISSWDLSGKTVTLKGGEGASPVASLVATNPQTFNGATADGAAITVSR
ncbi:MAG: AprI/Inh family metalloprotease inhibitor, partial [Pseudomonadota bacterium]